MYGNESMMNRPEVSAGIVILYLLLLAVGILINVFYLLSMQKALNRCAPESRTLTPGLVWLQLIPCFNLVWQFFVVIHVTTSLGNEYRRRELAADEKPGFGVGLAMCILYCCSIIPFIGIFASIAGIVCFIIFWSKIAGLSRTLGEQDEMNQWNETAAAPDPATGQPSTVQNLDQSGDEPPAPQQPM